jgi:hypothetical protein
VIGMNKLEEITMENGEITMDNDQITFETGKDEE